MQQLQEQLEQAHAALQAKEAELVSAHTMLDSAGRKEHEELLRLQVRVRQTLVLVQHVFYCWGKAAGCTVAFSHEHGIALAAVSPDLAPQLVQLLPGRFLTSTH